MKASTFALALTATLSTGALGVAVDGVQPFPLQFHWSNGPNGFMVCTLDEFKCGEGCCSDVCINHSCWRSLMLTRTLGDRLLRQHWLLSRRVSYNFLLPIHSVSTLNLLVTLLMCYLCPSTLSLTILSSHNSFLSPPDFIHAPAMPMRLVFSCSILHAVNRRSHISKLAACTSKKKLTA
jgi:hypothetical protein